MDKPLLQVSRFLLRAERSNQQTGQTLYVYNGPKATGGFKIVGSNEGPCKGQNVGIRLFIETP